MHDTHTRPEEQQLVVEQQQFGEEEEEEEEEQPQQVGHPQAQAGAPTRREEQAQELERRDGDSEGQGDGRKSHRSHRSSLDHGAWSNIQLQRVRGVDEKIKMPEDGHSQPCRDRFSAWYADRN